LDGQDFVPRAVYAVIWSIWLE